MTLNVLSTVVLLRGFPEHGLKQGDLGAVVETFGVDKVDVEFVTASGNTKAILTLSQTDVRVANDADIPAVRSIDAA